MSDDLFELGLPTSKIEVSETHWYENDISFADTVRNLQSQGLLAKTNLTLPMPYLSVSQIELYLQCPTKFRFRYIDGQRTSTSAAMVQGTTIHAAVEYGYKHVMNEKELPDLEKTLSLYSDELDQSLTQDVVWEDDEDSDDIFGKKDIGVVKDQGVGIIKTWHKNKLPKVKPIAVEKSFVTSMGGIPVVGKVDLLEEGVIVDNKVVKKNWSPGSAEGKLQMTVYAHATGISKQRYDLFIKTKIPKITELLTSRSPQQVRWGVRIVQDVAKAISAGNFPVCSPDSFLCNPKYCGYWSVCRGAP